jgi:hypothetical protein
MGSRGIYTTSGDASIPANSVQEGKPIPYRNADLCAEFNGGSCLATNDGTNLSLNQVHNSVGNATRNAVEQNALLAV